MGEGADRDQVGTGRGQRRGGLEVDATRHLDEDPGAGGVHPGHALGDLGDRHVVEHDDGGSGRYGLIDLLERSHSTSTIRPGQRLRARATASAMDMPAEVVVLHQNGIGEPASMIVAAACPDGGLLEGA